LSAYKPRRADLCAPRSNHTSHPHLLAFELRAFSLALTHSNAAAPLGVTAFEPSRASLRGPRSNRNFSGDFHTPPKKCAFFKPFLRFLLAFSFFLGYSRLRPGFFAAKHGEVDSRPASILSEWKDKLGG
jgi:hypothetical protein